MNPHPITPEVEEFVKWMRCMPYIYQPFQHKWFNASDMNGGYLTTAELFDWWRLNVKK